MNCWLNSAGWVTHVLSFFVSRGKYRRESNTVALPANYLLTDPWIKTNITGIKLATEVSISKQLCHMKRQKDDKKKMFFRNKSHLFFYCCYLLCTTLGGVLLMLRMHGLMV